MCPVCIPPLLTASIHLSICFLPLPLCQLLYVPRCIAGPKKKEGGADLDQINGYLIMRRFGRNMNHNK